LAERNPESPLRRGSRVRPARPTSPPSVLPLIALDWTPEYSLMHLAAALVDCSHRGLGARALSSVVFDASAARKHLKHSPAPLLPFVSRPEYLRTRVPATSCTASDASVLRSSPSVGSGGSTTLGDRSSDPHQACLTWLCCAFRLSQPLDALFRLCPSGLVSCR
jgi:hypothetical protein